MESPSIAVIGLSGSGKTVLTGVLTKNMSVADGQGIYLEPRTFKTTQFMEKVMATLNAGEWPASTPQGELQEFEWRLNFPNGQWFPMVLVDLAGQDLFNLFHEDKIDQPHMLSPGLRAVAREFENAAIVLFLIDIGDIFRSRSVASTLQATLKAALDYLCREPDRSVCIVISKTDLYRRQRDECGGWEGVLKAYFPYIYAAYVQTKRIRVVGVSAVGATKQVPDGKGGFRRVPDAGEMLSARPVSELGWWIKEKAYQCILKGMPTLSRPEQPHDGGSRYVGADVNVDGESAELARADSTVNELVNNENDELIQLVHKLHTWSNTVGGSIETLIHLYITEHNIHWWLLAYYVVIVITFLSCLFVVAHIVVWVLTAILTSVGIKVAPVPWFPN